MYIRKEKKSIPQSMPEGKRLSLTTEKEQCQTKWMTEQFCVCRSDRRDFRTFDNASKTGSLNGLRDEWLKNFTWISNRTHHRLLKTKLTTVTTIMLHSPSSAIFDPDSAHWIFCRGAVEWGSSENTEWGWVEREDEKTSTVLHLFGFFLLKGDVG